MGENQLEPRRQRSIQAGNLVVQLISSDVAYFADFTLVRLQIYVLLKEQNVVDLVLTPHAIALVSVVDTREEMEVFRAYLTQRDSQLVVEPPLGSPSDSQGIQFFPFAFDIMQRVTTACIGITIRKRYLVGRPSLQQHFALGIEQKHTEGSMQPDVPVFVHPVAIPLGGVSQRLVLLVYQDAVLLQGQFLKFGRRGRTRVADLGMLQQGSGEPSEASQKRHAEDGHCFCVLLVSLALYNGPIPNANSTRQNYLRQL